MTFVSSARQDGQCTWRTLADTLGHADSASGEQICVVAASRRQDEALSGNQGGVAVECDQLLHEALALPFRGQLVGDGRQRVALADQVKATGPRRAGADVICGAVEHRSL